MTKKLFLVLVSALFLVFMLVACGDDKKGDDTTDTDDTAMAADADNTDTGDTATTPDEDATDTGDTAVNSDEDNADTDDPETDSDDTATDIDDTTTDIDTSNTDTDDDEPWPDFDSIAETDPVWREKYQKADESAKRVSDDVVKANNRLGLEIFSRLAKDEGAKNVMISPLSIAISMAMTANGAVDEALDEMKEVLGFGEMDLPDVNEQFSQLIASLVEADKDMVLEIADSIWMDDAFAPGVKEDFISVLEDFYSAALFTENFADAETVGKINSWVSEKTHEKIGRIIDEIGPNTVMYIINAIYFKAGWTTPFNLEETHQGSFKLSDGTFKNVDFMHGGGFGAPDLYFNLNHEEGYSVVRIPYGRDVFAFYGFVRPGSIEDFISDIAENGIDSYLEEMRIYQLYELELPKFKFAYEKSLKDTFTALGIGQIFNGGLDNIASDVEDLHVNDIYHKTFIEVNEEGTEAAGYTYIDPEPGGDPDGFFGTHPFVFVIRDDRTGSILFIGKVEDPTAE
ncbi:serpin family protein [bacterium]|nr:serpin family protein [bacterium]